VFLGQPLSDPSIPSLVFEGSDGEILGFIGSLVHRMRFEERRIRLACSSSLVVAPRARQLGAGGLLLRKYLVGPQDLTITDTAGIATERMWKRLGGSMYHLGSVTWLHILHPLRAAVGLRLWHLGRQQLLPMARPLCKPLDAMYSRFKDTDGTSDVEKYTEEQLSPQLLIDHLRLGPQRFHLWPDYDAESLGMLFDQIGRSRSNGLLVKKFVRDARGQPLGWYIASLLPSDIYRVLGLAAAPGNEELLFRHVLNRARDLNAAAVAGRLEPWLLEVFPRRVMMFLRVRFLVHSRNEAICAAVRSSRALLTGLESDIWIPR
jgi:GNAT superfamily N-acetyltransferase